MTLFVANDLDACAAVWLMTGAHNSDDDYERYIASIRELDRLASGRDAAALMIVDAGNPAPNAAWRRKIAEASDALVCKPAFALASPSAFVRGVVTAINWLRPPAWPTKTFSDVDDAVSWLEATLGRTIPMRALIDRVRAAASSSPR